MDFVSDRPVRAFPAYDRRVVMWALVGASALALALGSSRAVDVSLTEPQGFDEDEGHVHFSLRTVKSGSWSDPGIWSPARVPRMGDRALISRGTRVVYDARSDDVVRLIQIVGTLTFTRDQDTLLNVGVLKVQNSDTCSESGFACDFHGVSAAGEPGSVPEGEMPALEVGTREAPIPASHTARIRLHYLEGMKKDDAPAIACCSARMELHGRPLRRTWVKLAADVEPGDSTVVASESVSDWHVGDEVIVTGSERRPRQRTFRDQPDSVTTEERRITAIDGSRVTLDRPLAHEHSGSGEFRSEIANLSRNVVIESADPTGVRGHTVYHRFSRGGISYARFAHLGKEGTLGRYSIHFHLVGNTMRGASVVGAAIVDSHNRWITIHGTNYMVVQDCVGYRSVGHGFFLEDGTEVYNVLDRNLGVQAYRAKRLPHQALPFDPNDGAAFWWANGRNTIVRNVTCENDEYGYRYDMQKTSHFDSRLPLLMPDGEERVVDVRTVPIWRFEDNEAHTEGLYGMVVAANGGRQPDSPIRTRKMLEHIRNLDWTGPDARHPHVIRGLKVWEAHYAFRPHSPAMLMEDIRIDRAAYGIYRPAFDDHVYRKLHLSRVGPEPFNRGMDDASAQNGRFTVDGLILEDIHNSSQSHPIVHMTDNDLTGRAESHFRGLTIRSCDPRRPIFNRGGSVRADPIVDRGVPYYIHDYFGSGRHARIVSTKARHLVADGHEYREAPPLTGDHSRVAEVTDVPFPELLAPVDDLPPATIITSVRRVKGRLLVEGISHDNGEIDAVTVNGEKAKVESVVAGVASWRLLVEVPRNGTVVAHARDRAGNVEKTAHQRVLRRSRLAKF